MKIILTEQQVKKLITESAKKTIINKIYRNINKLGLTSKIYNDNDWSGIKKLIEVIRNTDGVNEVSYGTVDGGYRQNNEGTKWKEYKIEIDSIQGVINGNLNAYFDGGENDPYERYDLTLVLW
jgi:hypothetical protein